MAKGYVVGSNKCLIPSYDAEEIEKISGYFVGEWADGNPNGEDRSGRFVASSNSSNKIELANADSYVAGVSETYEGDTKKAKVNPIGLTTVQDNGTLSVGDKCMPSANGIAVKSNNNLGYRVVARIDSKHVQIIVAPNNDMVQRIKNDMVNMDGIQKEWGSNSVSFAQGKVDIIVPDDWNELWILVGIPMNKGSDEEIYLGNYMEFIVTKSMLKSVNENSGHPDTQQSITLNNCYPSDSDGWCNVEVGRNYISGATRYYVQVQKLYSSKTDVTTDALVFVEARK